MYVKAGGARILFDAGPDPAVLRRNAERLGVDLGGADFAVVSHAHGNRTGGLRLLASLKPGLRMYVPPDEGLRRYIESLGLEPVCVNSTVEVARGVYVVKPLYGPPLEVALAIRTSRGLVVLVGCSHLGVVSILRQAAGDTGARPHIVLGGFHMAGAQAREVENTVSQLVGMGLRRSIRYTAAGTG